MFHVEHVETQLLDYIVSIVHNKILSEMTQNKARMRIKHKAKMCVTLINLVRNYISHGEIVVTTIYQFFD